MQPNLPLEDALQLVHLYAERGSPKFEKAALARHYERSLARHAAHRGDFTASEEEPAPLGERLVVEALEPVGPVAVIRRWVLAVAVPAHSAAGICLAARDVTVLASRDGPPTAARRAAHVRVRLAPPHHHGDYAFAAVKLLRF